MNGIVVANKNVGLGDALSVFSVLDEPRPHISVFANSQHFRDLCRFNPFARIADSKWDGLRLVHCSEIQKPTADNLGLHFFQKIRKAAGLDFSATPRAYLFPEPQPKFNQTTVCFGFDVGRSAQAQRRMVHPRAREFYPEHWPAFQRAVDDLADEVRFIEIGQRSFEFRNVERRTGIPLAETIEVMSRCHAYFGMVSGLMHLAAALRLPSVIIVNFPQPEFIRFPYEQYAYDVDWLYPQNIHLHEDRGGGEVELLSYASIVESLRRVCAMSPTQRASST
jgi:hypothetical protein